MAPNILLYTSDDADPLFYGGRFATTPFSTALRARLPAAYQTVLDELTPTAEAHFEVGHSGAMLLNAHSVAPICTASRHAMLSGRYASSQLNDPHGRRYVCEWRVDLNPKQRTPREDHCHQQRAAALASWQGST